MIIHISGASGSGKSTIGDKLKKYFKGNKVIVIDMDDIMDIFIEKHTKEIDTTEQFGIKYQKFIDNYIEQMRKKYNNIIFVGLNAFVVNESHYYENELGIEKSIKLPKKYFNLQSDYNFYIDLPSEIIIKQMFYRGYDKHIDWFCKWMKDRKNIVFNELINDEKKAQKDISIAINRLFDFTDINKNIVTWNKFYKNKKYEFLSREEIYDKIIKIMNGSVQQKGGNYYNKYLKYKYKYTKMMKGGQKENIIFITGKAASGKSSVAKKFEKDGYFLLSLDELIRHELALEMKNEIDAEFNGDYTYLYRLYRNDDNTQIISKARNLFIKTVKDIITKHKKIVIEGSLWNNDAIRQIFGKDDEFTFYFVKPKNEEIYLERLKLRFIEDPNNYGCLGFLWKNDADGKALKDYNKNGINGKLINNLINTVGKKEYARVDEWINRYKDEFLKMQIYNN